VFRAGSATFSSEHALEGNEFDGALTSGIGGALGFLTQESGAAMSEPAQGVSSGVGDRPPHRDSSPGVTGASMSRSPGAGDAVLAGRDAKSERELLDQLCNDQVRRWGAGERVPAEAYLARYPRIQDAGEAAIELIYGEFLLREELGETPSPDEFHWRFPEFAARLDKQLALHGALISDDSFPQPVADAPAAGDPSESDTADGAAQFIAPGFKILGELGHGGMGTVYKARQVRLKRVVALKVIRADAYADRAAAARFHAEAEAAARIQHPNIVQVFEVGEHEGMGYLVLEYVAGGSLNSRLAGLLQQARDSARLLETLARAIHYAHRHGIVHRDLKPSNILLTDDGVPKISDFGLAKLLERDEGLTQPGDIVGTPSYMAPEQIRGFSHKITPATDVYSLGAILYEMLTGRPPFKGTTLLSTIQQVSSQEPLAPGKIQRHTPRDLEIICLKCLEKDPRRRYATALELAEDLERYLDGRPILARPTPAWERAWKWARRRPSAATALSSALLAVALLLGGSLYYNARLRAAVRTARAAEQASAANARAVVDQRNLALKAFNQLVYDVQEKLGQTPATRTLRQELLGSAIAGLDEIAQSTIGSAPDLSQAVAHQKLGDIFRIVGRSADARRHYERSRTLAETLLTAAPDEIRVAEELYQTYMGLGLLSVSAQQLGDAKAEFGGAVALSESIAAADPKHNGRHQDLIEAYLQLGRAHSFAGEFVPAQACFQQMRDLAERWVSEEPASHEAKDLLASSYRKLGDLKKFARDLAGARRDYLDAIAIDRTLLAAEPLNFAFKSHLATALDDLAGVVKDQREFPLARQHFQEAERLFAELVESDPDRREYRLTLLHTTWNRAMLERDDSQFAQAAQYFRLALDQLLKLEREGRLVERGDSYANSAALQREIAFCEAAPTALADLDFARSQPVLLAARLLIFRARTLADNNDPRQAAAAAQALCTLTADDPDVLFDLARQLALLITDLDARRWPNLPQPEQEALRQGCADRATALLVRAHERGFRDFDRLRGTDLNVLRHHPGYQSLVSRLEQPK
jgi:tRNA A-37 threonylcarbamoyl transferase component Bud32/tetratricopeptide (TPR) repeat protein